MENENVVLCGASYYNQNYYLNNDFAKLPSVVKDELQILCVTFVEEVGGVLTLEFTPDEELVFNVQATEGDPRFDEIGSGLKIKQLQKEKEELMEQLTLFYKLIVKGGAL
ncbi:MAG: hypothetical protein KBS83_07715 [Lachnospiraceae bacterium]|nr:hypothetical protein [Candidatus Equihabitans merdae]